MVNDREGTLPDEGNISLCQFVAKTFFINAFHQTRTKNPVDGDGSIHQLAGEPLVFAGNGFASIFNYTLRHFIFFCLRSHRKKIGYGPLLIVVPNELFVAKDNRKLLKNRSNLFPHGVFCVISFLKKFE